MRIRCNNPNTSSWNWYGGKGITISPLWEDFKVFYDHVGSKPSPKHSLDRYPDKNGNYEPGNVRWATSKEQIANRNPLTRRKPRLSKVRRPEDRVLFPSLKIKRPVPERCLPNADRKFRENFVVRWRLRGYTLEQIGVALGVSRQRINQIIERKIKELK